MDTMAIGDFIKPFSINNFWKSLFGSHEIIYNRDRYAISGNNELIQFNTNTGLISLTTRPP